MKFGEHTYEHDKDGNRSAEFVTKEDGVIPLRYLARDFNINLFQALYWEKEDLLGLLLDVKPGTEAEPWDQHFWISRDSRVVLDDKEYEELSPEEQAIYRRTNYMKVKFIVVSSIESQIYVCREGIGALASMLGEDALQNLEVRERYQYERQHNSAFAEEFGYVLDAVMERLEYLAGRGKDFDKTDQKSARTHS